MTSRSMCTRTRFGRARRRFRKLRVALGLCGVRRNTDAVRAFRPMTGATPPFGCLVRHGDGRDVHAIPTSPGVAPGPSIPCGKAKRRAGTGASRPWSARPDSPTGQVVGQRVLQRLEATLDTLPGRTVGWERPRSGGGMGCTSPSCPMPIEACLDGGSLPATASMAGSASPLRRPWHNRQRASDIRNRRRVHRRRDFVSRDPRSTMYTRGSASVRAPGGQNGSPDSRLERHHGEDVGGRVAIGVRLRLGDNPVADSAADTRAVTTGGAALRHHAAPTRGKGAAPPCATLHTGARFSGGSKGGGSQPLASPGVLHGVGWLDHRSVAQASFGTPPKHLSGHRPKLHPPGHRRQAPRPVGRQPHERRGGRGRPDRWRRSLPRRPVSALPGTPPGPEFVDPGRSCGP